MTKTQGLNRLRPKLISIAVASCFVTSTALANPTGPTVVNGSAAIQQAGNLLQITNSPSAIINWQSFSIGANEITRFIQQSQASAVMNRVTGAAGVIDPSVILGALQSNGRVLLINPSGIMFGAGAQVDVAGLVASSLNLSNADFLANRLRFTDVPGAGAVVNQGTINAASGGGVYLVGSAVTNNGIITSPQGEVILAAGNSVELVSPGTPNLRVEINAPDNEAVNLGQVVAEAGRVGIYAGLIRNGGTISANSAVAEGGKILLKATKQVTLESTSILDASGNGGGTIEVLSKSGGTVNVAGRLDASAPNGGDGGFIDTSADYLKVAPGTIVTTHAPQGKTGLWLIDPIGGDYTIAPSGGDITGADLATSLGSTNVTWTSDMGAAYGSGAINVNDTVSWNSAFTLQLVGRGNVNVNSPITNAGTGNIGLYAGWDGVDFLNPSISCCGTINLLAPITTFGTAILAGANGVTQSASGVITAASLLAGGSGDVLLNSAVNNVGTLAGDTQGSFRFTNGSSLIVGSVVSGNTSIGTIDGVSSTDTNEIVITVTTGNLTVNKNILAVGGNSNNASIALDAQNNLSVNDSLIKAQGVAGEGGGDATVALTAQTGNIALTNSIVEAVGDGGGCCGSTGTAVVSMSASAIGGSIILNGSVVNATGNGINGSPALVEIYAGTGGISMTSGSEINVTSTNGPATADLSADGNVTLNGTTISVQSSNNAAYGGSAADSGPASVLVDSGGSISMVGGSITVASGNAGSANNSSGQASAIASSAVVDLFAADGITMDGAITVTGGNGGSATSLGGGNSLASGGSAEVLIDGGTGPVIVGGNILAKGGNAGTATNPAGSIATGGNAYVSIGTGIGEVTTSGTVTAIAGAGGIVSTADAGAVGYGGEALIGIGSETGPVTINGAVASTGGNGGNANGTGINGACGAPGGFVGNACAQGGPGGVFIFGGSGDVTLNGSIQATGGAGGTAAGTTHNADGGEAFVAVTGGGLLTIGAGGITATGGSGGSITGPRRGGDAFIILEGPSTCEFECFGSGPAGDIVIGGNLNVTGGAGTGGGGGGNANVIATGTYVNLPVGVTISATGGGNSGYGGPIGVADVELNSLGNVTLGGDITTSGENPFGSDNGIAIWAGDAIISEGGVLDAKKAVGANNFPTITLEAVNGIGSETDPILFADGGMDIRVMNTGTTLGDISISFVTGNVLVDGDFDEFFNNNPTSTYFIRLENGNFDLQIPFAPNGLPLLDEQSVSLDVNGNATFGSGSNIVTGTGTITATATGALNIAGGSFTASVINLQGSSVTSNGALTGGPVNATATGGNVSLSQTPSIVLGQLSGIGVTVVSSGGAIVDGNAGANVIATSAGLVAAAGIGSFVDSLETQVGTLGLSSGSGEIGIINTGNLVLSGLTLTGPGVAAVGTSGTLTVAGVASSGGDLLLTANGNLTVNQNVSAGGTAELDSLANVDIKPTSSTVTVSGNTVLLIASGDVNVGAATATQPTNVTASDLVAVSAGGNFAVRGGSATGASASVTGNGTGAGVSTLGNVIVTGGSGDNAYAEVVGTNVAMSVGGTAQLTAGAGSGAYAKIESLSPTTIFLDFPNNTTGDGTTDFIVGGTPGAIVDAAGTSGFFAGGSPAVLTMNLIVTPSPVIVTPPPTEPLVTDGGDTTSDQVTDNLNTISDINSGPETQGDSSTGTPDEKEKKGLPTCT